MHYVLLSISIVFEVFGTTCMKLSNGFSDPLFTACTIAAYVVAFGVFIIVLKTMHLGLAYGIWGGVGTVATAIIGCLAWGDPFTLFTGLGMALVIAGICLMQAGTDESIEKELSKANVAS